MKRLRWLLALLTVLLMATGGVATWASAHRGYPDVVYYARFVALPSLASWQVSVEEWVDPWRHRLYSRALSIDGTTTWLSTGGFTYRGGADAGITTMYYWPSIDGLTIIVLPPNQTTNSRAPIPSSEPAYQVQVDRALVAGGWPRVYAGWTSQCHGRGVPVQLARRHALWRAARRRILCVAQSPGRTVWVDIQTRQPVQVEYSGIYGPNVVVRFLRWARLAPYTLPAAFFDPPSTQPSLWNRFTGWVHDHIHR